jgi:hypothetical protein
VQDQDAPAHHAGQGQHIEHLVHLRPDGVWVCVRGGHGWGFITGAAPPPRAGVPSRGPGGSCSG